MKCKLSAYARLMRLDKPIGTYLVCWPMLWALWVAGVGHPDGFIVLVFLLGAFIMRSAGCVINDYADRHVDAHIERTKNRPLATGEISSIEALIVFVVLISLAFLLVLLLNSFTLKLAVAAVFLAAFYPFVKRWSHLPQLVLGVAFAWSIPMAFAALQNTIPYQAWIIFLTTVLWVVAYDTMYAMVDRNDDYHVGVKSTAILFGNHDKTIILLLQCTMFSLLFGLGIDQCWGVFYYLGLTIAASFAGYQQYLIRNRERTACFNAFLNNHYLGAAIFFGLVIDYAI